MTQAGTDITVRPCQGTPANRDCPNIPEPGSTHCAQCGGVSIQDPSEMRSYLIHQADISRRLAQLDAQYQPVRDLQRASSLTHLMIERNLDQLNEGKFSAAACKTLDELLRRIESLSKTTVALQEKLHLLLPREAVLSLGQQIVQIVIEELGDVPGYEVIVDRIINRIFPAINNTKIVEV